MQESMNIVIIQPPLVQLNTPYPAGAYLASFFRYLYKQRNKTGSVRWLDLSQGLFRSLFCKSGLELLFSESASKALAMASEAERSGDDATAFHLRRYVSESGLWCSWIDRIMAVVCGSAAGLSGHEFVHEFIRSAHAPRGMRMERYLSELKRPPAADDAEVLASLALADLADYVTAVYDGNFALIRYAESVACSTERFSDIEKTLDSPVLACFYEKLLGTLFKDVKDTLFCISVPFPGTFAAALYTARYIKRHAGSGCVVAIGGGYVNTELRNVQEQKLFDYVDVISYDRGYGSFLCLFDEAGENALPSVLDGRQLYKMRYRYNGAIVDPSEKDVLRYMQQEDSLTRLIFPDYSDIDFSQYPRLADTENPMQRIWSDGAWMKVFLAYGCYWHKCAFCDTTLEYVNKYCLTDIKLLYDNMRRQAEKAGVYGLHFVDEACPPAALERFALLNCTSGTGRRFTFWGNVRFEKTFSRDLADLLSFGGMTGVSAGIEIATCSGLSAVNKGTDMENIVSACCAFKEAGILVHSYMIFGFWNQNEQDLIDSMETLRQLFAAGLLDSAFWHKFTLTRHSTVYREWTEGKHPDLHPLAGSGGAFAENNVRFEGEEQSARYSAGLDAAVESWMKGKKVAAPVESWFDFSMPKPSVKKEYIGSLIARYEKRRDSEFADNSPCRCVWLGGRPVVLPSSGGHSQLCWSYMGDLLYADTDSTSAAGIADLLWSARPEAADAEGMQGMESPLLIAQIGVQLFKKLRGRGLCRLI